MAKQTLNLVKASGLVIVGIVIAIIAYLNQSITDWTNRPETSGLLYRTLGKDGMVIVLAALGAFLILIGAIWLIRLVRKGTQNGQV